MAKLTLRKPAKRYLWPAIFGLTCLVFAISGRALFPIASATIETEIFDIYQRAWPRPYADAGVRIVDIDDASLSRIGQWPWSRDDLARMTRKLTELGAATIVYDFVFAEPDRTSPASIVRKWGQTPGLESFVKQIGALPDHDEDFAHAVGEGPVVLSSGLLGRTNAVAPLIKVPIATVGATTLDDLPLFSGAVINLPDLEAAASGLATFSFAGESDSIVRSIPIASRLGDKIVPSLELEALRVATGASTVALRRDDVGLFAGGRSLKAKIGRILLRAEIDGGYRLRFTGRVPERMVPAWRVLDPASDVADAIRGHIILIGTSAAGLSDLRATPLDPYEPGVEIHAEALEQMILGINLIRPDGVRFLELGGAIVAGIVLLLLAAHIRFVYLIPGIAVFVAACIGASIATFLFRGILVDPIAILFPALSAGIGSAATRYVLFERDARRLKTAFGQYLSPAMVERLSANHGELRLGGESRRISCIFTDLEDFTQFSERAEPEVLVSVINAYLGGLCEVTAKHGGTVVKMIGDAVHVMFNAPLDMPDHANRAVACALDMDLFAVGFAEETNARGVTFGATRIGVNTGSAVVGNFGGNRRFDYSAYGDTVNVAARLEAANKGLGTRICVSEATMRDAPLFQFRPLGLVTLKGKSEPLAVFEPLHAAESQLRALAADYRQQRDQDVPLAASAS